MEFLDKEFHKIVSEDTSGYYVGAGSIDIVQVVDSSTVYHRRLKKIYGGQISTAIETLKIISDQIFGLKLISTHLYTMDGVIDAIIASLYVFTCETRNNMLLYSQHVKRSYMTLRRWSNWLERECSSHNVKIQLVGEYLDNCIDASTSASFNIVVKLSPQEGSTRLHFVSTVVKTITRLKQKTYDPWVTLTHSWYQK